MKHLRSLWFSIRLAALLLVAWCKGERLK